MTQIPNENTTTERQETRSVKPKRKVLRGILCTISAVILLLILFLVTALTNSGQRLFIQLADHFIDNLHIAQIDGGLQDGLQLKQIAFHTQGIKADIEQANIKLDLHCLLSGKICLKNLTLNQPKIQIDTAQLPKSETKTSQPIQQIKLPVEVDINGIEINQLDLTIDQQQVKLAKFRTALTLNNEQGLTLLPTEINGLTIVHRHLTEKTAKKKKSEKTVRSPVDWEKLTQRLNQPLLPDMPEIELPFDLHIQGIQGKNWLYQQIGNSNIPQSDLHQIEISTIYLHADSIDNSIQLQTFQLESNLGQLRGEGTLQLKQEFPIELQVQATLNELKHDGKLLLPHSNINLTLSGNLKKQTALFLQTQGTFESILQGKIELYSQKTPFDIELKVINGQYPFEKNSTEPLKIQDMFFTAKGDLLNYQATLQGKLIGMGMPETDVDLALQGGLTQFTLQQLQVNALNMKANANANVSWKDKLKLKSNIDLKGHNVRLNNMRINKIDLLANISLQDIMQGQVDLDIDGFSLNNIKLNSTKLQIKGTEQQHYLILKSKGEPASATLNLQGKFDRTLQQWQGILSQVNIHSLIGNLTNSENILLSYDNKKTIAQVSAHCWRSSDIHLCFPQEFIVGKTGEIPFDFKTINLALVNKLISQEIFKGHLSGQGKFAWFTESSPYLTLQLKGDNLNVTKKLDYRTFRLAIPTLNITTELQNNNLTLNSNFNIQNRGDVNMELKLADLTNQKRLSGHLKISDMNLNIVNQLIASSEKVDGQVNAKLSFTGDLSNPLLNGEFAVSQVRAKLKSVPFGITNGNIILSFYGDRSILKGNIQTHESHLNVEGQANWRKIDDWQAGLHINADKFKVDIPSIAKLQVSPNIEIHATPKRLALSGNVDIPWARIEIERLPDNIVAPSKDEVILDGPQKTKVVKLMKGEIETTTKSGIQIHSDLKIKLGDHVRLEAYGLKTELNGLLSVKQEKGNLGLFGQINLHNGHYESFGQDLLIRKGIISFSGLPSQPMLNIEAIRNPTSMENTNMTVGAKIVGIADSPEITIFSEPSTSQDQALSYLLTGRSLENSGNNGSGGSLGAALLGIGLAKSGKLVGGIGKVFGIQNLNLDTSGVGDSSKVVVSGNITPTLQIKYGIGLFDGLAELTLRYRLLPKLYLQSVSGINQAVDLLYQFEF
ncbi:autotransporter assembly complex protein TamB [Histophilus somni]|uniref:autotransporter assembly complex protein TamB n=1 Tax=Histophilus somni TaxID=731 RepID=UPI00094B13D9|nr:translocation/assembly module TamB domain-containing protein [Histophilus somni]